MLGQQVGDQVRVHCTVFTKFMENYRLSSSFRIGTQIQALRRPDGSDELFAIRSDDYIERFYVDPNSSTGYMSQTTTLHGSFIAAVQDAEGRSLVFAAQAEQVFCIEETTPGSGKFSDPFHVPASLPYNARKVKGIYARLLNHEVWLGALIEAGPNQEDISTYIVYGKWKGHDTHLENSGLTVTSDRCTWCSQGGDEPIFVVFGRAIVGIRALTGSVYRFPDPKPEPGDSACRDVDVIYDSAIAQDVLLVVFGDGSLYALPTKEGGTWSRLNQDGLEMTTIRVCSDPLNNIHLFALNNAGVLHHGFLTMAGEEPFSTLAPIKSDVRDLAVSETSGQDVTVFAPSAQSAGLVYYLIYEASSSNWNIQTLTLPSTDTVQRYSSYTTEITTYDSSGVVLPMTPVWVWAKEHTRLEVNGGVCFVGPRNKVNLKTDAKGQLSLAQETGLLAVPEIFVEFDLPATAAKGLRRTGENTLVVNQYVPVQKRLEAITGDELRKAVKADSTALLEAQYRTEETTNALASALRQCMDYVPKAQVTSCLASNNEGTSAGCFWTAPKNLDAVGRIYLAPGMTGWSLQKKDGTLVYQTLTAEEEIQLLGEAGNTMLGRGGIKSFFKRLGDLIRAAAEKVVEVVKVVVTTIGGVVKTVINYVKDKVEYLFQTIVENVQMVFDVVESIFDQVQVFFEDLFEWLAYIFKWDDILRTKDIMTYYILELVKFAEGTVDYAEQRVDDALAKALDQTQFAFDELIKKLDPNLSVGATLNGTGFGTEPSPAVNEAISNNFLLTQYLGRDIPGNHAQASAFPILAVDQGIFDEFQVILEEMVKTVGDSQAFAKAAEYFKNMLSDRENVFRLLLCGLLEVMKGLAVVVLASAKAAVKALFRLIKQLFQAIRALLNTEINLPFLSSFYSLIAKGTKLTLIEVPALLMALPATILHKILAGKAPFPDQTSMDEFKSLFNAQRLTSLIIPRQADAVPMLAAGVTAVPTHWQIVLGVFAVVSSGLYYITSLAGDSISACSVEAPIVPMGLTITTICGEAIWVGATAPWFTLSPSWAEILNWAMCGAGTVYDIVVTVWQKAIPEHLGKDGFTVGTTAYGIALLATGILGLVFASSSVTGAGGVLNIAPPVICISKIGLTKFLTEATEGASPLLVVCVGLIGAFVIPIATASTLPTSVVEASSKVMPPSSSI